MVLIKVINYVKISLFIEHMNVEFGALCDTIFVEFNDPKLRDSWETLSSEEIWNLEQEEELGKLYKNLSRQFALQDMKEAWEAQWKPEWKMDYNYLE